MRPSVRPRFELILTVATAVVVAVPLAAQEATPPGAETPERRFRFTLSGGATFSKFVGTTADTAGLTTRVGYLFGGGVAYELSERFALGVEGRLMQKGAKQSVVSNKPGLGYNLTYLDLGLVGSYTILPEATVVPVIFGGPTVSFEMDCKQPMLFYGSVLQSNCLNHVEREQTEFGFDVGIGLSYKMVFVAGHYLRSFKSLVEELDLTNNGFAITAGVRF